MKKIILFLLVSVITMSGYAQTNMVGAWQQKDTVGGKVVQFRNSNNSLGITKLTTPATLSDSLRNYARLQDGLISGGSATIGAGSVTIDTAYYRLLDTNRISLPRTFTGIANSPTGTQYYLLIYGNTSGVLDTISGTRDTIAAIPANPVNTVKINTILVGDGGVESSEPDLSGYAKIDGSNTNASSFRSALNLSTYYVSKTVSDTKTGNLSINGNLSSISSIRTTGYDNPGYSSGKGIEFRYDTANDRGSFLSYDRDNNLLKPMIFQATNYLFGDDIGTPGKLGINVNPPAYDLDVKGDVNIGSGSVYRINGIALSYENPLTFASPLSRSTNTISIPPATTSESGYLASTDWNTFNNKQNALGYTPYNPASYPVNAGGETLQSVTDRGSTTTTGATFGGLVSTYGNQINLYGANSEIVNRNAASLDLYGSGTNKNLSLKSDGSSEFSGTGRATNFGAGIAPNANHGFTGAASTSTTTPFLITPGVAYTGTQNGALHYVTADSTLRMMRFGSSDQVIFNNNNKSLRGLGNIAIAGNNNGDLGGLPLVANLTDINIPITANRTLTTVDFGANGVCTVYANATSGNITVTLPTASLMNGLTVFVVKTDSSGNTVTVDGGATNINAATTTVLSAQFNNTRIKSNGTQFYIF